MSLIGSNNEQKIWNYLINKIGNPHGVAGLMGNMQAESGLQPTNLQNSYNKSLGYTDIAYTNAVDNGTYTNFVNDSAGYGLVQWTYWSLKEYLLNFAKKKHKSIGDLEMQLECICTQLKEQYPSVWTALINAKNILDASNAVLLKFERPADQSDNIQKKRAAYGQAIYDKYNKLQGTLSNKKSSFVMRTTKPDKGNKYYITKENGGYSDAIKGHPTDTDCDVLANCVGYAYGRFNEIGGYGSCRYLRPVNAENFMQYKGNLKVGQTPKLGACMVWQRGSTLSDSDGAGHVAIVEKVISDTEIITSESGYGSSPPFWNQTREKGTGNWGESSAYKFLGFIYNPAVSDNAVVTQDNSTSSQISKTVKYAVGDIVDFTGTIHYTSSMAISGSKCNPGVAKVTSVSKSAKHQYHLIREKDGGSTVYGWVDAHTISGLHKTTTENQKEEKTMGYTNSSLVAYTKFSPNHSGQRTHSIDRITPHCVVGQCSVETLGEIFYPSSKEASCQYGIGADGRIGMYVEEKNRSWCSSSNANDQRAVTIECASDAFHPYAFKDVVYQSLINLCVDICKRNGKTKLIWFGDKNKTLNYSPAPNEMILTVHRWFDNKSCPGDWMYARMGDLAAKVNAKLGSHTNTPSVTNKPVNTATFAIGDIVNFTGNTHYSSSTVSKGSPCKAGTAKVTAIAKNTKHPYHLICEQNGGSTVYGWVNASDVSNKKVTVARPATFTPYTVRVTADELNIRKGAGTNYAITGSIKDKGVYTIVGEASGKGATKWGKLKSGIGYISLDYCKKT